MDDLLLQSTPSTWLTNTSTTTPAANSTQCVEMDTSAMNLMYAIFMVLLLLCSVFGNTVVILAVFLSNKLTDRSTFYFIASLACADIVRAVFQIPFRISFTLNKTMFCLGLSACYIRILMDVFGNVASIANLFLISVDRFIAIEMPYRYIVLLSHRRAKILMVVIWSLSAFWASTGIFRWTSGDSSDSILAILIDQMQCLNVNVPFFMTSFFGVYIPILILMTFIYVRILQVALIQIRRIQTNIPKPIFTSQHNKKAAPKSKGRWSTQIRKGSLHKEVKATKSVAIVYLTFCLCWLPGAVFYAISILSPSYFGTISYETVRLLWYAFVDIFPMVNTMINPIIYSFSNTQFRNAVQDVYRKFMGKAAKRDSIFAFNSERNETMTGMISNQDSPCLRGEYVEHGRDMGDNGAANDSLL